MSDHCNDFVVLPNYGPVYCDRPRGHDGDHKAQSLYDFSDIRWKPVE